MKQDKTLDKMKSKILQQEKEIEELSKDFDDLLKECESFAEFMPTFVENSRQSSERVL